MWFMEVNGLWDGRQHGSRAGHSTLTQLLEHYDTIVDALDGGENIDVIYLDFAKAFDKVDHPILLAKLRALGIGGQVGSWLGSFLVDREQKVKVGDSLSKSETILSSVPKGFDLRTIFISNFCNGYRDSFQF